MKLNSKMVVKVSSVIISAMLLSGTASAATVIGSIWENDPTGSGHVTIANIPTTTPDVTFSTSSPINFNSAVGGYTIGGFIGAGTTSTVLTGASQLGNTLDNTFFNFTGTVTVTNGETFTSSHDDGLTFVIGGVTVISSPGIQSATVTTGTWTGASGTYSFDLAYGETNGAPAVLTISLPLSSATPEPSSLLLMGGGLLGVAALLKRKIAA